MVPSKFSAHIGGGEMVKVHPAGGNAAISEIEEAVAQSVDAMFNDLVWWAKVLTPARESP
jgi:hypothetical protein